MEQHSNNIVDIRYQHEEMKQTILKTTDKRLNVAVRHIADFALVVDGQQRNLGIITDLHDQCRIRTLWTP